MSFREKSAWVSFVCLLLLTFGVAFSQHFHTHDAQGNDVVNPLHFALAIFVGIHSPASRAARDHRGAVAEGRAHAEGRARAVHRAEAARIGFYSLVAGEVIAMGAFHAHGRVGTLMWTVCSPS